MPLLTSMVRNFCNLPTICAEEILWNFTVDELQNFIDAFTYRILLTKKQKINSKKLEELQLESDVWSDEIYWVLK